MFLYLLDTNTSLCLPCLMNITVSFVTCLYENLCSQDVDTDIARNVWMKPLDGEVSWSSLGAHALL